MPFPNSPHHAAAAKCDLGSVRFPAFTSGPLAQQTCDFHQALFNISCLWKLNRPWYREKLSNETCMCVYEQDPILFLCEPDLKVPLSLQQFLDLVHSATRHNSTQSHATLPEQYYERHLFTMPVINVARCHRPEATLLENFSTRPLVVLLACLQCFVNMWGD
jgi:hypothetical protein